MNDHFSPKGLIRMVVALFVASMIVSFFQLTGALKFMVFLGVYFGVSYIFFNSADQLEKDHTRKTLEEINRDILASFKADEAEREAGDQSPEEKASDKETQKSEAEDVAFLDSRLQLAICEIIPNTNKDALKTDTTFYPVLPGDDTTPQFNEVVNQIFITQPLFERFLVLVSESFKVDVPLEKIDDWAMETELSEISSWLTNAEPAGLA
ncbi:MAG: hypothetical protein QNL04_10580 [SAR324 cluster bacterium]|nr:hypothetical protein [SAR324 cluster bacterium]